MQFLPSMLPVVPETKSKALQNQIAKAAGQSTLAPQQAKAKLTKSGWKR